MPPLWVIVVCALAIALGTYLGGWRIIRTLGKGLVEIESPQGMAAESSSAASHSAVHPLRLRAVDHAGLHRFGAGQRAGQARRRGALGRGRPDGGRVAGHAAVGRAGRGDHLLDRAPHRRIRRCDHRLRAAGRGLCRHLHPVAARSRSTTRTSTPNGKAASPPGSKVRTNVSRRPIPGPGRHAAPHRSGSDDPTVSAGNLS